jgi:diaminopimelate epimerase
VELRFEKYEGCGNDFLVVELESVPASDRVAAWCDRHFGVGADGVLIVAPASDPTAKARMIVVNADGSRPEMCGNGLRCVALHLARRSGDRTAAYGIETDSGRLECHIERAGDRAQVETTLGNARPSGAITHSFRGQDLVLERVSMGNPHAILFDADFDLAAIDELGPALSAAAPGGTNVELVRERGPGHFELIVWERGVGRTLACGTGAAATAVALARAGRVAFGEAARIELPGGTLQVRVDAADLAVTVKGPARHVFSGTLFSA